MQKKVETYYRLAIEQFHLGNYEAAIEIFKKLLTYDFRHMDAHFYLALAYQKTHAYELSNAHFHTAQKWGLGMQNFAKHLGFNYLQLALYKDAIFVLQKLLRIVPEDHEAYALLGAVYRAQNSLHYAVQMYTEAIKIAPKKPEYYLELARLYKEDQPHLALTQTRKALALEPENLQALMILASLHAQLDEHEQAVACYKKILTHNLDNAAVHNLMAVSYDALGNRERAKTHIYIAVELWPENINFQNNLARISAKR